MSFHVGDFDGGVPDRMKIDYTVCHTSRGGDDVWDEPVGLAAEVAAVDLAIRVTR